jgi:formamidopyrimidine-DNA glycosylase
VPEILEVERYRRAAETVVGRTIERVDAPDRWYLKGGLDVRQLRAALVGRRLLAVRRRGKLLLLDTDGPTLGLRFGMTGRLIVDGRATLERLEYSPASTDAAWDRLRLWFAASGELAINDPRRLGGVVLDPDEDRLGIDALTATTAQLRQALGASRAPVKAALLDQRRVAGVGNLLADETFWRAGVDPARPASTLGADEWQRLHRALREVLRELDARGGSHTGDLHDSRHPGGVCPRDGAPLDRRTIGGRTTYSCPAHQT